MDNYLSLGKNDLDRHVYRIISIKRLREIFDSRKNVLVKPKLWDDPFENFILKSRVRLATGEFASFEFHDKFYGQCWTLHRASDAMWRIYSADGTGVRIRTTIRKLLNSAVETLGEWSNVQCFLGKVDYLSEKELGEFSQTVFRDIGYAKARDFAKTLLVKRRAFQHEKEIRLLYFEKEEGARDDLFRYSIDPNGLIDQIMTDPRLSKDDSEKLKKQITDELGFAGTVMRSLLYAPPKPMIIPFG